MTNNVWRVLALGVAFLGGCMFAILYSSSSAKLSDTAYPRRMGLNGDQNHNGDSRSEDGTPNRNRAWDQNRNQNGDSRSEDGTPNRNQNGNKPVFPPPVVETATKNLPKPNFSKAWKEDAKLKNLRTYGVVENIPHPDVLSAYNAQKLSAIYHSYLDNNDILCHRKLRMGQVGNCGWEVCDDYEWRPIAPCVIYSFGINYEFSFDDDAGRIYGCDVYSFDPSMSKQPTYQRSERVMYYRLGIGGQSGQPEKRTNGWTLYSLSSLRTLLNHTHTPIDVLKMDVEGSEWPSLSAMLKERQLDNVRQLLVEYHTTSDDAATLRSRLTIIGDLERAGFRKFYITKNAGCGRAAVGVPIKRTSCYEVHYVNDKFRRGRS
ncbi:putative methyltransferase-like protein 24 [Babylonia areolata]|uniref:putative methyltransferase-like protein 24 n=1 Tax=Babylonia areolata TaxID=304850 RepID=UPI003FD38B07